MENLCKTFKNIALGGEVNYRHGMRSLGSLFGDISKEELKKILEKHFEKCDFCQQNIRKMDVTKKIVVSVRLNIDIKKFEKEEEIEQN